ncbi:MAG: response regulator transcription factor [Draconibacterium sp.]|nr:response regulator transcription factor [Draconibacterium sp.]
MISVAIIDTHNPLMLESLAALLSGKDEITITGQFTAIGDFMKASRTVTINVLIINIYKAHIEEIELIKKISKEMSRIRVLVISMEMQESVIYESIKAGAKGYLTKQDSGSEILMAIYSLRGGYDYYNKSISNILLNNYIRTMGDDDSGKTSFPGNLSKREIEIIRFWGDGLTNKEMADKLFISTRTIESHKNHIMQKLNFKTSIDLLKFAIRNNLINV